MICYLVRHGKDDGTVRGGWSAQPLIEEGENQAKALAQYLSEHRETLNIKRIYSSDLLRARQTASPAADALGLPLSLLPNFREANNGDLAGMDNTLAKERYPGLFWNTLEWEERYPNGESPKDFYNRIKGAWSDFSADVCAGNGNVLLVTHSGVINIILHLVHGLAYSNKEKPRSIPHARLIALELEGGVWKEL